MQTPTWPRRPRNAEVRSMILDSVYKSRWGQPVKECCAQKKVVGGNTWCNERQTQALRVRRIIGPYARHSVPPEVIRPRPTLNVGTVPPPERAAGTTLNSTHADDAHAAPSASMCEHLVIRHDFAIGAARQRRPSKRARMKPPVPMSDSVPRALGSARWLASLLRVCAYRPFHPRSGRASGLFAVSPSGLEFRLSLCDLPVGSAAGRASETHTYLGYGAFRNDPPKWRRRRCLSASPCALPRRLSVAACLVVIRAVNAFC